MRPFQIASALAFVLLLSHASPCRADCAISRPDFDYAREFGLQDHELQLLRFEEQLVPGGPKAWVIAERATCGSSGCDYAIYQPLPGGCFQRVLEFRGHYRVIPKTGAQALIEIREPQPGTRAEVRSQWAYAPLQGRYQRIGVYAAGKGEP
jgi:hypothetical protein